MNYLYIDTEYTSFFSSDRLKSGELLQVGIVAVVDGVVSDTLNEYVRPLTAVWNNHAEKVHGISKNKASTAQHPNDLATKIVDFVEKNDRVFTVVGHSCSGDQKYIERLMLDCGVTARWHSRVRNSWQDTLTISKGRNLGISKYKLEDLAEYFNVKFDNAHDALADADMTRLVHENLLTMPKDDEYVPQNILGESHVDKRKKYMDKKYIQLGSGAIYITEHATSNPEAMKIIIEELWELYIEE